MIGFLLNIAGGLLNLFLYKRFNNEVNLLCFRINLVFAFLFLALDLTSMPILNV